MKTVQRRRAERRLVWLRTLFRKRVLAGLVLALAVCGLSPAQATVPDWVPIVTDVTLTGVVGEAFTGQLTVTYANPTPKVPEMPTFAFVAGTLPDGLTLNSDGSITGTPSAPFDGAFTFKANVGAYDSNTATCTLQIVDNTVPTLLTVSESSVAGSASVTAMVTLSGPARAGGLELAVASSDSAASVPATVTVPEGQTSATFEVAGNLTPADTTVTISATVNGSTASAQLLVLATNNTPVSLDEPVTVNPAPGTTITFPDVTAPGLTTVAVSIDPPPLPSGFSVGATYYDVHTTAVFTGLVTVGFAYDPDQFPDPENPPQLLHWDGSAWANVTTSVDTVEHIVYGQVSSFSPFAVTEPAPLYTIQLLYDPAEAKHAGSTLPIRIQLMHGSGAAVSGPSIVVTAQGVTNVATSVRAAADSPGNSNPNGRFRLTGHSYTYNLKTDNLTSGSYYLRFQVSGGPYVYSAPFRVK